MVLLYPQPDRPGVDPAALCSILPSSSSSLPPLPYKITCSGYSRSSALLNHDVDAPQSAIVKWHTVSPQRPSGEVDNTIRRFVGYLKERKKAAVFDASHPMFEDGKLVVPPQDAEVRSGD